MKLRIRHLIWSMIAITLLLLHIGLIIVALPIFLIVIIDYLLCKPIKKGNEIEEIPEDETTNIDQIRAVVEQIEKINNREKEYRRNVDLRQFKGRNNVTKEELAEYLWIHYVWEGRRQKEIICQEVAKVSNLKQEDIDWVMYEHYHHKGNDGTEGAGFWIRNEEAKREIEYERKKTREQDLEDKKFEEQCLAFENKYPKLKELRLNDEKNNKEKLAERQKIKEKHLYIFDYENWLKMKGYV